MNTKMQACFKLCLASSVLWPLCGAPSLAATAADNSGATANDLLRTAYEQISKSDFEAAMPTLCKVVRADRNSPTARRYLAFVLLQEGHAKQAMAQLDALKAIQDNSSSFDLLLRGVASDMVGERHKALEIFKQLMAAEPQNDYYRVKTIEELETLLQYDEALKLANEGYNSAKNPKAVAVYGRNIKKIKSIQRLTGRSGATASGPRVPGPAIR